MKNKRWVWGIILFGAALCFAGPPQVKQVRSSRQMVKTWLLGIDTVSVSGQSIFAKNKIRTGTFDLLTSDRNNRIVVTRTLKQNTMEYRITDLSGVRLGAFSLPANPDWPQPRLCVDPERQRLIRFHGNGVLEVRGFKGSVIWQKHLAAGRAFCYENSYFAELDSLGNTTVLFSFPVENGWESRLARFSAEGERLAAKTFYRRRALHLDISANGKWTAVLFTIENGAHGRKETESLILDDGFRRCSQGSQAYRKAVFADSSRVVFMSRDAFWGKNIKNSENTFYHKALPGHVFDHILVSPAGVVYAVSGKAHESADLYFTHLRIYVKDVYGSSYVEYEGPRGIEYLPHNLFWGDRETLWFGGRFGLYSMTFGRKAGAR